MSTMNVETSNVGSSRVIGLLGELTFDFNEMMRELTPDGTGLFGNMDSLIQKLAADGIGKLAAPDIEDLVNNGLNMEFYNAINVWGYLCVRPSDNASYIFSHADSENRDNEFARMRRGVAKFFKAGFDIYMIHFA
jgi:hypothetical protein